MQKERAVFWELTTWLLIISITIFSVFYFPWYQAENILRYVMSISGIAAVFWYLKSRRLYSESQEKTHELYIKQREIANRQKTIDLIFDHSADGILVLDENQKVVSFSPGMGRISGFKKEEVLGQPIKDALHFQGDADHSLLPDVMFLPTHVNKEEFVKNTLTTREGRLIDIEASCTTTKEAGTKHQYALAIIRDVTYENELARRDKDFIAITSHQLNTPLSIIRGYVSLLTNGKAGELNEVQKGYLKETTAALERMITLTNNLLSISRIEQEKIKLEKSDVNVNDLCAEIKKAYAGKAEKKALELKVDAPGEALIVYADQGKLMQALSNLIDNAIKYTDKGTIELTAQEKGGSLVLVVKDTGVGIKPDDLEKIGEKFFRSQEAITIDNQGTGLGVFIARTIIEKHGGTLQIESVLGKGTTFTIGLPTHQID